MKKIIAIACSIVFVLGLAMFFVGGKQVEQINIESEYQIRSLSIYDYIALAGMPISLASIPFLVNSFVKKFRILFVIPSSIVLILIWFGIIFARGS